MAGLGDMGWGSPHPRKRLSGQKPRWEVAMPDSTIEPIRLTRRGLLVRAGMTAVAACLPLRRVWADDDGPDPVAPIEPAGDAVAAAAAAPETLAAELFKALPGRQRAYLVHPADSPMLRGVHANWEISPIRIRALDVRNKALVTEMIRRTLAPEAYDRVRNAMRDDSGGIHNYSIGFIGSPNDEGRRFQFVIAGRHFTLRIDGNYDDRIAFGGPIVYGHGEERRPEVNLWHGHVRQATAIFEALDPSQQLRALVDSDLPDEFNPIPRDPAAREGLPLAAMTADQLAFTRATMSAMLAQYGERNLAEALATIEHNGGWPALQLAFYRRADRNRDRLWDVWRLEGPGVLYYFRGTPHVHAYIHIYAV
jgi:hypothetical protein